MGLVGWGGLPDKYVEVGGVHEVVTDTRRGTKEKMRCASAGSDARFIDLDGDGVRVVIIPRDEWEARILDLRKPHHER